METSLFSELKRRNVFRVAVAYVVISWLLIQVIGLAADSFEAPIWVMKMLIVILIVGFLPSLFFSWAFELTPEGLKKESEIVDEQSGSSYTAKKLDVITMVAVILVGGIIVYDRVVPERKSQLTTSPILSVQDKALEIKPNTIAVLPFIDLSQAGDQEYFSDGMAEEILNVLVGVNALEVASRTSAFQFKGQEIGIPEIAKKLKVRHILEGSVRKSGTTIRITAQLIDAKSDKHLWSNTYDRPLSADNLFAIQDEISNAIVKALSSTLNIKNLSSIDVIPVTNNLSAYDLYLEARPLYRARSQLNKADELLGKAIELDTNFAKAWEMRAALQTLKVIYNFSDTPFAEAVSLGNEFATHAISIQPASALAIAVLAYNKLEAMIHSRGSLKLASIIDEFNKALAIEPRNASALNWRGLTFIRTGQLTLAMDDFSKCLQYEPFYEPCLENQFFFLATTSNDKAGLIAYEKALELGIAKIEYADLLLLVREEKRLAFLSSTNHPKMLRGWHRHDELYEALKHPEMHHGELLKSIVNFSANKNDRDSGWIEYIKLALGDYDADLQWGAQWHKSFNRYRQSAQFKDFIIKTGVLEYWQDNGYPPQCRPLSESKLKGDFECD